MTREKVQTERDYFRRASYAMVVWLLVGGALYGVSHILGTAVIAIGAVLGFVSLWKNAP